MSKTWTDQGRKRNRIEKMKMRQRAAASRRVKINRKGITIRIWK